jgi:UDP-N-acetyl-D-mannosaminuronate dehydrogenase
VPDWAIDGREVRRVTDLDTDIVTADVVILLQNHSEYDLPQLAASAKLFLDTRGKLDALGAAGPNTEIL